MELFTQFFHDIFLASSAQQEHLPEPVIAVLVFTKITIDILAIIWMVWGVFLAVLKLIKLEFQTKILDIEQMVYKENIRAFLATYILLGLELFIVADIIQIIINPDESDILILVVVVIIRTVISYFLQKDFHEALENAKALKEGEFDNFKLPHILNHHMTKSTSKKKSDSL